MTRRALDTLSHYERLAIGVSLVAGILSSSKSAQAEASYPGSYFVAPPACVSCHTSSAPDGTSNTRNAFGSAWGQGTCSRQFWQNAACDALRAQDTDGDGATNAEEISWGTNPGVKDIDECARKISQCTANALCENDGPNAGDYTCACAATGFTPSGSGHGIVCTDIDECQAAGACSAYSACVNTAGSYRCPCEPGYFGDGKTAGGCFLGDACMSSPCSPLSVCTTSANGPVCGACPAGYAGDGKTCTNVDECATANGGCDPLTSCTDTPGGRTCGACAAGFTGDGIRGCKAPSCDATTCDAYATCALGDAGCTCSAGFTGTGKTCSDVDECAMNPCGSSACGNLPGTYICSCTAPPGNSGSMTPEAPGNGASNAGASSASRGPATLSILSLGSLTLLSALLLARRRRGFGIFATLACALGVVFACGGSDGGASPAGADGGDDDAGALTEPKPGNMPEGGTGAVSDAGQQDGGDPPDDAERIEDGGPADDARRPDAPAGEDGATPGPSCTRSCQCGPTQWCNPASQACESRRPAQPIDFDQIQGVFGKVGCTGCHDVDGAGAKDPRGTGSLAIFAGTPGAAYPNLVAGGVGCSAGANRVCVDEPADSLLATKTLDTPSTAGKPSITFSTWSDPDLQLILRWIASGAPRGGTGPSCGNQMVDPGEDCDEGSGPATTCAYGTATCTLCSAQCKRVQATGGVCGDGVVDIRYEACDDGNRTVEQVGPYGGATCGPDCTYVAGTVCGASGSPCCTTGPACGADLTCSAGTCKPSCGQQDLPCCAHAISAIKADGCIDSAYCSQGLGSPPATCVGCPSTGRAWTLSTTIIGRWDQGSTSTASTPLAASFPNGRAGACTITVNGSSLAGEASEAGCWVSLFVGSPSAASKWVADALCPPDWVNIVLENGGTASVDVRLAVTSNTVSYNVSCSLQNAPSPGPAYYAGFGPLVCTSHSGP